MSSTALCFAAPPEIVPLRVFVALSHLSCLDTREADWRRMSEEDLWEELCLCVLSSRTRFELASEALGRLKRAGLLRRLRAEPNLVLYSEVEAALRPRGRSGAVVARSIPFWRTRASQLVNAAVLLYVGRNEGLKALLSNATDAEELRSRLAMNIPGLGMKQASHFQQNVGFSHEFAVIDAHLLSFLRVNLMIIDVEPEALNKTLYIELEQRIQRLAAANGLDTSLLDRIVWNLKSG